ncbi:hypothetical protein D3C80_1197750 [compost metagenome]
MAFLPEAEFGIDRLVLIALATTQIFRAIGTVGDRGVTKGPFQPIERLQGNAVARIRVGTVGVETQLARRRHARGRGLQQADTTEVVLGVARLSMSQTAGQQQYGSKT